MLIVYVSSWRWQLVGFMLARAAEAQRSPSGFTLSPKPETQTLNRLPSCFPRLPSSFLDRVPSSFPTDSRAVFPPSIFQPQSPAGFDLREASIPGSRTARSRTARANRLVSPSQTAPARSLTACEPSVHPQLSMKPRAPSLQAL